MSGWGQTFYSLSLAIFLLADFLFIFNLKLSASDLEVWGRRLVLLGIASLLASILWRASIFGYFPLFTFYETILLLCLAAAITLVVLERIYGYGQLFLFGIPVVTLFLLGANFVSSGGVHLFPELRSPWLVLHIILVLAAYGIFAVLFVLASLYLLQDYYLKRKRFPQFLTRVPSLDVLDGLSYRLATLGFFLLTASIMLGALWSQRVWGRFWAWEPKETWALITWIVYAVSLHVRLLTGWQGRRVAQINFFGFLVVLFNYIVVRFFIAYGLHIFY